MGLTNKRLAFIEEYLQCWNSSEAARRAGYKGRPNTIGSRLLTNVDIMAEIKRRLAVKSMSADEVLLRLTEHARGDVGDYLNILPGGQAIINLEKAKQAKKLHLIKKLKVTKTGPEIELYDAQAALVQLGRAHQLFTDKVELVGWQQELLELLTSKTVTPEDIIDELGPDIAQEFFKQIGQVVVGDGAPETESEEEAQPEQIRLVAASARPPDAGS